VLHCRPELLVLEFKGTSRWKCCKPRRGCSCQPASEARQHALAMDGRRMTQGKERSKALGSLMAVVCPLHADHDAQGAIFHRTRPWWPQRAPRRLGAPASWRSSLTSQSRSPRPREAASKSGNSAGPEAMAHSVCTAVDTKAAWPWSRLARRRPPCLRGNVICSRIALSHLARPRSVKAQSTIRTEVLPMIPGKPSFLV
jgi:hypothetical protein